MASAQEAGKMELAMEDLLVIILVIKEVILLCRKFACYCVRDFGFSLALDFGLL